MLLARASAGLKKVFERFPKVLKTCWSLSRRLDRQVKRQSLSIGVHVMVMIVEARVQCCGGQSGRATCPGNELVLCLLLIQVKEEHWPELYT